MAIALYSLITFATVFSGGLLGMHLGRLLPEDDQSDATQKIVEDMAKMVTLIAALVLGLLVANAKGKFDTASQLTEEFAAKLMLINRELVNFGPEANDARALLRKYTIAKIAATWPKEAGPRPEPGDPRAWELLESFEQSLNGLAPRTEAQHSEAMIASAAEAELEKATWLEVAKESAHVQHPFGIMLDLWLFVLFVSFGLFAPRNGVVVAAMFIGALAITGAIFLVVDMDAPYTGILVVSPEPMQEALAHMSECSLIP